MTPHIYFHNSPTYDEMLKPIRTKESKELSGKIVKRRIRKFEAIWTKIESQILKEISGITKLGWEKPEIICYMTYGITPFSDPLTLSVNTTNDKLVDILIHELIHVIISQPSNPITFEHNWDKLMKAYRRESQIIRIHIVVHAIYSSVIKTLFSEKRLQDEIQTTTIPWASRAWKIVQREDYKNIIAELTKNVKYSK